MLATFPGITPVSGREWAGSWYWSFTTASARRLFAETFGPDGVDVAVWLAAEDLTAAERDHIDPDYELVITVRARKGHA